MIAPDAAVDKDATIRRRVLRNTVSNYIGKLWTISVGFFLTPFVLHRLGEAQYGLWILVGSVVAYSGLLDLGIGSAVTKYVAEYRVRGDDARLEGIVATALVLYGGLGALAVVLSCVIAPLFPVLFHVAPAEQAMATRLVLLMGVGVGLGIPCTTGTAILRGLHRFDLVNRVGILASVCFVTVTVGVLGVGGGVLPMVAATIGVTLAMQVVTVRLVRRAAPDFRWHWRAAQRALVRPILGFSAGVFAVQMAGRLQTQTDEIVIATFLPLSAVAPYSIARRLSEIAQLLTDQFMKVLLPLASELHAEDDHARLRTLYLTGTRLTLAIFFPFGAILIVLARPILTAWVGPAYGAYAWLVLILTLASLIDTSTWPAGSILQGMARHRPVAWMSLGSGIVNLVLSLLLVRRWGLTGVALGTLIPTTLECLGLILPYTLRVLGIRAGEAFRQTLLPTLLPVLPMLLALWGTTYVLPLNSLWTVGIAAGIGLLVYLVGYVVLGASALERQALQRSVDDLRQATTTYLRRRSA